jgi:hypothetical protein
MILILASIVDAAATLFAKEYADAAALSVLTCRDLAENRLVLRYPDFAASTLEIGGRVVCVDEIAGVINVLPAVFPQELVFYPPEEQEYQAAEFHALLTFFLASIRSPVINRPAAGSLAGPYVNPLSWHHLAQRLGIPVSSINVDTDNFVNPLTRPRSAAAFEVSCLAGRILAPSGTEADRHILALSRHAKVEYLRAVFEKTGSGSPELAMVRTVPDLGNAATRRALIDFFAQDSGRA